MKTNKLRTLLQSRKPTLGTRIHSTWPATIELIGRTGIYDYVEFLGEYASYTLPDLENMCRAAELYGLGSMIKLDQATRQYLAQRAIGTGFESVLFADSRDVEDVRDCIRIVRPDTPGDGGLYGAVTRRFSYAQPIDQAYVQSLRDIVIAIMIEKQPAVEHLEEILAVPGIDLIQWGPADYTMSIGRAGERRSPDIKAIEKRVIETCLRMGVPPRVEINSPDDAAYYLDLGVRHFNLSSDIAILFGWWKDNGEKLRKTIEG